MARTADGISLSRHQQRSSGAGGTLLRIVCNAARAPSARSIAHHSPNSSFPPLRVWMDLALHSLLRLAAMDAPARYLSRRLLRRGIGVVRRWRIWRMGSGCGSSTKTALARQHSGMGMATAWRQRGSGHGVWLTDQTAWSRAGSSMNMEKYLKDR